MKFNQLLQIGLWMQRKKIWIWGFSCFNLLTFLAFFIHDFNVTIFGLYLPFLRAWVPLLTKELFGFYQNLWISNLNTCWWYTIQHVLSQITVSMCEYFEKFIHMNTAIQSCFQIYNVVPLFVILVVSTQKYWCNNFNHVYQDILHVSSSICLKIYEIWVSNLNGIWFSNMCWINQTTLLRYE